MKNVTTKCLRVHVRTRVYLTLFAHFKFAHSVSQTHREILYGRVLRRIWCRLSGEL